MTFDSGAAAELRALPLPPAAVARKLPAAIAASAAILIVVAGLELLSAAGFLAPAGDGSDGPPLGGPLRALFDHIVPVSVVRAAIDVLALLAASAIIRGRRWGRVAGIAVSAWWALAYAAFGVAFSFSLPEGMAVSMPSAFVGIWRGAAIATGFFWAAVAGTPGFILTRRSASRWFVPAA